MKVDYIRNEDVLLIEFNEEIDHCKTEELRNKIDYEIEKYSPQKVIFDFPSCSSNAFACFLLFQKASSKPSKRRIPSKFVPVPTCSHILLSAVIA